jgi:hypothetical protein
MHCQFVAQQKDGKIKICGLSKRKPIKMPPRYCSLTSLPKNIWITFATKPKTPMLNIRNTLLKSVKANPRNVSNTASVINSVLFIRTT